MFEFDFQCVKLKISIKSDTVLPAARHRCDISSKGAVLPGRNDAEMGPANSLHASAYYSEYNERFDLMLNVKKMFKVIALSVKKKLLIFFFF